jgi:alpha-tubulin suppressor-like RCC1 family protein
LGLGHYRDQKTPRQVLNLKVKQQASAAAGCFHTVVIDLENNVWIFGNNTRGQLGLNNNQHKNIPTQIPNFKAQQVASRVLRAPETSAGYNHTGVIETFNQM